MITNYYDGSLEKDETKQYKLIKKVSDNGTLFLYYKTKEKTKDEIEKEELKNRIEELEDIAENLTLTILDLIPEGEEGV